MANDKQHEELRLLYDVSVKDIAFFKKQQWFVAYYALLAYGAIVSTAVAKLSPNTLLWFATAGLAILSSLLLATLEHSIHVRQARLRVIRAQFTPAFNSAWEAKKKDKDYFLVLLCLLFVIGAGAAVSAVAIGRAANAT